MAFTVGKRPLNGSLVTAVRPGSENEAIDVELDADTRAVLETCWQLNSGSVARWRTCDTPSIASPGRQFDGSLVHPLSTHLRMGSNYDIGWVDNDALPRASFSRKTLRLYTAPLRPAKGRAYERRIRLALFGSMAYLRRRALRQLVGRATRCLLLIKSEKLYWISAQS